MCLNQYFPNTQCHLYSHPVTVWCLMSSKHPSGKGDMHDLMVEGIRLLCIRKHIAIELLKLLDLYATLIYRSMSTISFSKRYDLVVDNISMFMIGKPQS